MDIEGKEEQKATVLCASKPEHFENEVFREWLFKQREEI